MIPPKETIYNGYRFRSRLEARWAVFFDAMNIPYTYEPEGFDLTDGSSYLPDFYLKDFDLYVEIKPFDKKIVHHVGDGNQWEKKCALFRDSTDCAILLCYGDPADNLFKLLFAFDIGDSSAGTSEWNCLFTQVNGHSVIVTEPTWHHDIYISGFSSNLKQNPNIETFSDYIWNKAMMSTDEKTEWAKTIARQARFEHGERPITERNYR